MGSTGGDAEVIVLSDSEDEIENLIDNNPDGENLINFSSHPFESPEPHSELSLFDTDDDFVVPFWPLPNSNQCDPSFGSDTRLMDELIDLHNDQFGSTSMGAGATFMNAEPLHDSSHHQLNISSELVDNPLAFGGDDPSLQLFLPTRPSGATQHVELTDQPPAVSNGFASDDWISLRLGSGGDCEPDVAPVGLNLRQQPLSNDGALDSLTNTASLVLGMSDGRSDKISREKSDSPFSFPRQKRSVRPRLHLSIDTDSGED